MAATGAGLAVGSHGSLTDDLNLDLTFTFPERQLHALGDALTIARAHDNPIDYQLDAVLELLAQLRRLFQPAQLSVDPRPRKAPGSVFSKQLTELALAMLHQGRKDLQLRSLGKLQQVRDDLLGGLAVNLLATEMAVLNPYSRVEHTKVVVDLGDRTHG